MSLEKMNYPPKLAYLAFAFTGGEHGIGTPRVNSEKARQMAIAIMKDNPDWFVIVPHYSVDAMLDGTIIWEGQLDFGKWRRSQGGLMSLAFLARADILILGCDPQYKYSHGVTWEWIFTQLLNRSYRKDNPIKIVYAKDLLGEELYMKIMETK